MKNIVLCADGTGNKGGSGDDSNVYKIFQSVDLRPKDQSTTPDQISFYDNGVGTQDNDIIRSISAGMGVGFKNNVRDLYEFLARNYTHHENPEIREKIYVFGFSRGAATARAFTGMVQWCGLINREKFKNNGVFEEKKFQQSIDQAMDYYQSSAPPRSEPGKHDPNIDQSDSRKRWDSDLVYPHDELRIHFLGIWDTVSALGFPKNFSPAWSNGFKWIFNRLEYCANKIAPHQFYDYQPHLIVDNVYHALAIDDKRSTFHPIIWDERPNLAAGKPKPKTIEQVWFAGVHSNVGGGYPRAGLSDVALEWMMKRAEKCGLRFNPGSIEEVYYSANVQGELFDSRKNLGVFYRYGPRDINGLCRIDQETPLIKPGTIKIHNTVIERMKRATDSYAPGFLPDQFQITKTAVDSEIITERIITDKSKWDRLSEKLSDYVKTKQLVYRAFIETTLLVMLLPLIVPEVRTCTKDCDVGYVGAMEYINDVLISMAPAFMENMIYFSTITQPWIFFAFILYMMWFFMLPNHALGKHVQKASEQKRAIFLKAIDPADCKKDEIIDDDQARTIKEWEPTRLIHKLSDYFVDKFGWSIKYLGDLLSLIIYPLVAYLLYKIVHWIVTESIQLINWFMNLF
ncbi:MAG: DUF2235 domain-containing protein [Magnetococcales bacterium]|nr:DUF2235 domain-containing protein [Magnetococcales bacterium]